MHPVIKGNRKVPFFAFQLVSQTEKLRPVISISLIENLLAMAPAHAIPSFYRTSAGAEIDFILEISGQGVWAIEIKRGLAPTLSSGFYRTYEDIQPDHCFVVYSGTARYPLRDNIEVIGLQALVEILSQLT